MKILNEVISNLETYRGVEYINREELIKSLNLAKEELTKQLSIQGVVNCKNTLHELKILPQYFWEVYNGNKTFELRKDDRDYKVGDFLKLKEWNYSNYTGKECFRQIKYILKDCEKYGLKKGFVLLAIK